MKAMVLAAGMGARMRPLSDLLAKPVLPVLNQPLLHHTLRLLARHGVRDVVINTHHRPETIRRAVGNGRRFGLRVRYSHEPEILGSGGGPRRVREFFGAGPALLVNGDCVFDFDLTRLLRRHRDSGAVATLALRTNLHPLHYPPVVCDRRGRVLAIRGLPKVARGVRSLFTGVHLLDPSLLERLPEGSSDIVSALYAPLVAEGRPVLGLRMAGRWLDLGTPGQYLSAQIALLRSVAGRRSDGSLVAAGVSVGAGGRVLRSVLGRGCTVGPGAVVSSSVLWAGARVGAGARVSSCIVTGDARVEAGQRLTRTIVLQAGCVPIG